MSYGDTRDNGKAAGSYYRMYKGRGDAFRQAFIEVSDGKVIATSPALRFMKGWDHGKVAQRARENGYAMVQIVNGKRPPSLDLKDGESTHRPSASEIARRTTS